MTLPRNGLQFRSSRWLRVVSSVSVLGLGLGLGGCHFKIPEALLVTPSPSPVVRQADATPSAGSELYPSGDAPETGYSHSPLRNFYLHKYTREQLESTRAVVDMVLTNYHHADATQAQAEILAFHWVIFHETDYHRLSMNHATIRPYEGMLKRICHDFDVPMAPVLAIVSWENSGSGNKVSWADAAGLGQMTWGAIDEAHRSAARMVELLKAQAKQHPELGSHLHTQAEALSLASRHARLARQHHLKDERFSPEANLEDVVMFYKFLLDKYGGCVDLAIVAYHQGVGNMDAILEDYLTRKDPSAPNASDRGLFIDAINKWKITYVTLWNDERSRQMLNGLRTMDGVPTTPENKDNALGDESDIYLWKVLGSLAGYQRGGAFVQKMMARDKAPQAQVEVGGLPIYNSASGIRQAVEAGRLIHSRLVSQPGQGAAPLEADYQGLENAITPELDGYLLNLRARFRQATGDNAANLPLRTLLDVRDLQRGSKSLFTTVQLRGVTACLVPSRLSAEPRSALNKLLKEDYTMDRIYWVGLRDKSELLCLNPRYGDDFLNLAQILQAPASSSSTKSSSQGSSASDASSKDAQF